MANLTNNHIEELRYRINQTTAHFQGRIPERNTIAWRAYLAALLEWGLVDVPIYDSLLTLLPDVDDDPVLSILVGWD